MTLYILQHSSFIKNINYFILLIKILCKTIMLNLHISKPLLSNSLFKGFLQITNLKKVYISVIFKVNTEKYN
ncbi:hypothetical protein SMUL_1898 [Sulfurospirillum multivorans DSM 12446]|uniref:Uncharacterized protein n=2 Tax=Sulfurospirillum multivorans TaxID=66821 RepID=A0AA86APC3_SULMK|nr:hypothetical protein SMUL_1898 [Sulfurospirillum multivorans DSM 12446]QEH06641.1 hypothetical protein SMN_1876 [Sulfurospirillum multivorans]